MKTGLIESFCQVQDQSYRSLLFSPPWWLNLSFSSKSLTHSAFSSSIASILGIPLNSIFVLTFRNHWRSQSFPPTSHRKHERDGPLNRDILRNQEEHRCASLLRPSLTLFHLLQEFHHISLCFSRQIQRHFGMRTITTPLLSLPCNSSPPSQDHSLPSAYLRLNFSALHSSTVCPSDLTLPCRIANASPALSSSPHIWPTAWHLLLPPSESAPPPSPRCPAW